MSIPHHLEPYPWAAAGVGIGAITLLLLWITNQRLGIATGYENLCGLVIEAPYFRRSEIAGSHGWRLPFLGVLYERFPSRLRLPAPKVGTGDG